MEIEERHDIEYEGKIIPIEEYRKIMKKKNKNVKSLEINSKQIVEEYRKEFEQMKPSDTKSISIYVNDVKKNKYVIEAMRMQDVDEKLLENIQSKSLEEILTIIDMLKLKKVQKEKQRYRKYYSVGTSSFSGLIAYIVGKMLGLDLSFVAEQLQNSDIFNSFIDEIEIDVGNEDEDQPISPYVKIVGLMGGTTVLTALINKYLPESIGKTIKEKTIQQLKDGNLDGVANTISKVIDNPITETISGFMSNNSTSKKKKKNKKSF